MFLKQNILDLTIKNREGKKDFVFYDGPIYANAKPGIHHVLAKTIKDTFCKYKTMQGYRVLRKIGLDTHGLPIEVNVEKKLGFKSKADIEAFGIENFCRECNKATALNIDEINAVTDKMGQFIDCEHPYVTCSNEYIESEWWLLKEMDKKGFGWTKKEFYRNDYEIHYIDGITCEIEKDYANKTYLVIRKDCSKYFYCLQDVNLPAVLINQYALLNKNSNYVIAFDENKDVLESMIDRLVKLRVESEAKKPKKSNSRKQKKGKWIPPQLTHLKREGKDHRHGHNVTGDDFMKCFGIRGGEFGNWTNDHDRQVNLNMAFDAFCDMADALNISRRDIGLIGLETGALAIAFGARGHSGALAHYEPEREVINLTKMKGAGSLAHEWGHALDDYIGKMSEIHRFGKLASMSLNDQKIPDCFRSVIHALCLNEDHKITKYYSDSSIFGGMFSTSGHGYWTSNEELFARAFACYVKDKLSGRNDYLVGHADIGKAEHQGKTIYVYPVGEERKQFDQKMDKMIQGLKEIGYLHDPIKAYEFETPEAKLHVSKEIGIKITNVHQMSFADFGI